MTDDRFGSRLAALLGTLAPKTKQPAAAKVLNNWISQAEGKLGDEAKGGRLGWLIASSVAIAAVQRAIDAEGRQLFLLKGGTLLQHRLKATARTTKDVDGLIRGDFDIILELRGVTWCRIQFEVSPDEARIGDDSESIEPPPLTGFGLPDPDSLVGIAMRFQIAQKLHAVSDPHRPPETLNDRPRDVVDLLLLRDLAAETESPTLIEIHAAGRAVFEARADEAKHLGLPIRTWPPTVIAHPHWTEDFTRAAGSAGINSSIEEAVAEVNAWIAEIDGSRH